MAEILHTHIFVLYTLPSIFKFSLERLGKVGY